MDMPKQRKPAKFESPDFNVVTLEILLAHYYLPEVSILSLASKEAVVKLRNMGLLELDDDEHDPDSTSSGCVITDKGRAHVVSLCSMPLPTQVWVGHCHEND